MEIEFYYNNCKYLCVVDKDENLTEFFVEIFDHKSRPYWLYVTESAKVKALIPELITFLAKKE